MTNSPLKIYSPELKEKFGIPDFIFKANLRSIDSETTYLKIKDAPLDVKTSHVQWAVNDYIGAVLEDLKRKRFPLDKIFSQKVDFNNYKDEIKVNDLTSKNNMIFTGKIEGIDLKQMNIEVPQQVDAPVQQTAQTEQTQAPKARIQAELEL